MSNDLIKFGVILSLTDKFGGNAAKATKKAMGFDKSINGINKKIGELNKLSKQGSAFKGLATSFRQTQKDIVGTTSKVTSLQKQLDKLGSGGKGFKTKHREMIKLQRQLTNQKQRLNENRRALQQESHALKQNGGEVKNLNRYLKQLEKQKTRLRNQRSKQQNLGLAQSRIDGVKSRYGRQARWAVAGSAVLGAGAGRAFMTREDAEIDLKMAMLKKGGVLPKSYAGISRQAQSLGNRLPGNSADFFGAAKSLSQQGVAPEVIKNGGLKAASYLGVISNISPELAATITAKSREAYGLKGSELVDMADLIQRKQAAFGITAEDGLSTTQNLAPTLRMLGIGGMNNLKDLSALEGISAGSSLEGSEFGTSMARFLEGTAESKNKLNTKALRPYADILKSKGISLDFYDKKGQFKGLRNAISELEELKANLNPQQFTNLTDKLFGDRGKKAVTFFGEKGIAGLNSALAKMDNIASMEDKLNLKTSSLSSKFETLFGTLSDVAASVFKPFTDSIKSGLDWSNEALTSFGEWHEQLSNGNQTAVSSGVLFGSTMVGIGMVKFGNSMLVRAVAKFTGKQLPKATSKLGLFKKVISSLGPVLRGVGSAVLWVGRLLLMNPIGLAITAIAGAAYLIYKNWKPIKGFFVGIWKTIKSAADEGIGGVTKLLVNWSPVGLMYKAIRAGLSLLSIDLPADFTSFGGMMMDGLINGIKSKWTSIKASIQDTGNNIVSTFKQTLGINSPSRVMAKQVGQWIPAGVEVGMKNNLGSLQKTAQKLLGPALMMGGLAMPTAYAANTASGINSSASGVAIHVAAPVVNVKIEGSHLNSSELRALIQQEMSKVGQQIGMGIRSTLFDEG